MGGNAVVLGAGPAGLWTALSLLRDHPGLSVTVLEKEAVPGGIAASFSRGGLTWDRGSHRFHPSASQEVFDSVRELLGEDLLKRRRNGRIRLEGRFLKYPLKPGDMLRRLPPSFTAGVMIDALTSPFRKAAPSEGSFDETLEAGLGATICRRFYFPYAQKLWGLDPGMLDGEQARRRVSASRLGAMVRKIAGFQSSSNKGSFFYYPRGGFGLIFQRAVERITEAGGKVVFGTEVTGLSPSERTVFTASGSFPSDFTFSTIPAPELVRIISPSPPSAVSSAARRLDYRSMVLCCIKFPVDMITPFDAHYFPGRETVFSRISERKNYEDVNEAPGCTGLCVEIPCWRTDRLWSLDDDGITEMVLGQLRASGLAVPRPVLGFTERIKNAYPSYPLGWKDSFSIIDEWLREIPGVVSLGRQGLFAHDNTHHAMEMGMEAAACLDGSLAWNGKRWAESRKSFANHVVQD